MATIYMKGGTKMVSFAFFIYYSLQLHSPQLVSLLSPSRFLLVFYVYCCVYFKITLVFPVLLLLNVYISIFHANHMLYDLVYSKLTSDEHS